VGQPPAEVRVAEELGIRVTVHGDLLRVRPPNSAALEYLAGLRRLEVFASHKVVTIETHRAQIMKKLGCQCQSVAEPTKYAIREGLATVD